MQIFAAVRVKLGKAEEGQKLRVNAVQIGPNDCAEILCKG
jgi:hypothetical protein